MNFLIEALAALGRTAINMFSGVGRLMLFTLQALRAAVVPPYYFGRLAEQMALIGWFSLPVVGLTALFTGAALAQQIYVGGGRFNAESTVPAIVVFGMIRELGPVLVGLMVAGRVASSMAAELGTMRVTEQIDALATLRADPFRWLIAPRLVASVVMLPLLVMVANAIGIMGGWLLSVNKLGFNSGAYLATTRKFIEHDDFIMALMKAAVFGFFIALLGCYHGYRASGGAAGVGNATTHAVVSSFIMILLSNLIITLMVFG
jgi:phospholipid/cholesterol/gamma-HCH transport system permease protein